MASARQERLVNALGRREAGRPRGMLGRREGVCPKGKVALLVPLNHEMWHNLVGRPITWGGPCRSKGYVRPKTGQSWLFLGVALRPRTKSVKLLTESKLSGTTSFGSAVTPTLFRGTRRHQRRRSVYHVATIAVGGRLD